MGKVDEALDVSVLEMNSDVYRDLIGQGLEVL
jgi:hypothetical protein